MNEAEVLAVLEERGAILHGHFRLSSGRHSSTFVQKFRVLEDPRLTQRFGEGIAAMFDDDFDVVVTPALGAIVLGFATALAADARSIFAERVEERLTLRRGFGIRPHERALVVEDVVTTGGSAREVVDLVRKSAAQVVGVGALLDRADPERSLDLGAPFKSLATVEIPSWDPSRCPLCEANEPIEDPGSKRLSV